MTRLRWWRARGEPPPGSATPEASSDPAGRRPRWRSRRWRVAAVAGLTFLIVVSALTGRLFIWPDRGMPVRVSAIVMLNGPGDRLSAALRLAREQRAPFVVISRGSQVFGHGSVCAPHIQHVDVICFDPSPSTTRGEAEFVGVLAKKYHWRSVVLVTSTPQDSRARLRVARCFAGPVYVMTVPVSLASWPYEIAYEWAAMVKALVFQRSC